ncbi:MAG: APC family permease [Pseudomonadota bacterium]
MLPEPAQYAGGSAAPQRLKPVLGLGALLVYGMIIMQVVAPIPVFGLLEQRSDGHAVLAVLVAMLAMLITAVSYGRMAPLYPLAGSAYTYVGRSLHANLGFLVGWALLLDYAMILLLSALIPALATQRLLPEVPLPALTFAVVVLMTGLNLLGIRTTLFANKVLLLVTSLAVCAFLAFAVRHLFVHGGWSAVVSLQPLYDPATFEPRAVLSGISLAALTYIGFDGLTTYAEDSIHPRRDMVLATVLVVAITGVLSAIELYFLHAVLPDWRTSDPNTSYLDVMRIVGGTLLFSTFLVIMSVSQIGAGFSVQGAVARLLFGMGRDGALPRRFFGRLSVRGNPAFNIVFVGALAYVASLCISFERACDLLNFGAFLGFMGVNAAAAWSYYLRPPANYHRSLVRDLLLPASGFLLCLIFWLAVPTPSKLAGGAWLLVGIAYLAWKTRGFRETAPLLDPGEPRAAAEIQTSHPRRGY